MALLRRLQIPRKGRRPLRTIEGLKVEQLTKMEATTMRVQQLPMGTAKLGSSSALQDLRASDDAETNLPIRTAKRQRMVTQNKHQASASATEKTMKVV